LQPVGRARRKKRLDLGRLVHRGVEPAIEIARVENDWHAVMQRPHQIIRVCGQNRTRFHRLLVFVPALPQAGEGEGLAVTSPNVMRLLSAFELLPLVEAIGEDEAAALAKGGPEGRFAGSERALMRL